MPGPPLGVTASAGDGTASVTWSPPASNGGSSITNYTVTPYIGSSAQGPLSVTVSGTVTSASILGLTDGTAYTFTVVATNALGAGPASAASNSADSEPATRSSRNAELGYRDGRSRDGHRRVDCPFQRRKSNYQLRRYAV